MNSKHHTTRGKNWSTNEDEALCRSWLDVSQDPVVSTNQKSETLYRRIRQKFVEICQETNVAIDFELRGEKGLKSRWSVINKGVCKFVGCVTQITSRQQSGFSPQDVLREALLLYSTKEKSPFSLMHCYHILKDAPKWSQYVALTKVFS